MPEIPDVIVDKALDLTQKRDRRIWQILLVVVAAAFGSFSAWATFTSKAEALIDARIDAKVIPLLNDHERRITEASSDMKDMKSDVAEVKADIRVIKQILSDRLPERHR